MLPNQGLTREEILRKIENNDIQGTPAIKQAIQCMKLNTKMKKFEIVKVGDVWNNKGLGGHPAVVISIKKDKFYSLLLSTSESKYHNIYKSNSRFFQGSYLTNTVICSSKELIIENFVGTYDSQKELLKVKSIFKKLIYSI